jgi:hypothetical protein
LTETGQMLGTPQYMAPEQIKDAAKADIRADIYSLGCTAYYLLTGAGPFQKKSGLYELLHAQQFESAQPLNELRHDVPAELAGVVAKMTAKDPLHRYQKPGDAAQALVPFFKDGLEQISIGRDGDKTYVPGHAPHVAGTDTDPLMKAHTPAPAGAAPAAAARGLGVDSAPTILDNVAVKAPQPVVGNRLPVTGGSRSNRDRKRPIWGRVVALVVLLGIAVLWWVGVIDVKQKYGTLELEVNEPNAEVYIDGGLMEVPWDNDGKKAEMQVKTGDRRIEVSKDGYTVAAKDLMFKDGERQEFKAKLTLIPTMPTGGLPPGGLPPGGLPPGATASLPGTAGPAGTSPGQGMPASAAGNTSGPTSTSTSSPTTPSAGFEGHAAGQERDDNGLKVKLAWCPPGKFTMGSPHSEKDRGVDEEQVDVTLTKGFWLGKSEVTQAQWSQLMATTPWKGETNVQEGPDFPATFVNFADVAEFCFRGTWCHPL